MKKRKQFNATLQIRACVTMVVQDDGPHKYIATASWPTSATEKCTVKLKLFNGHFSWSDFVFHTRDTTAKRWAEERGLTDGAQVQLEKQMRDTIKTGEDV